MSSNTELYRPLFERTDANKNLPIFVAEAELDNPTPVRLIDYTNSLNRVIAIINNLKNFPPFTTEWVNARDIQHYFVMVWLRERVQHSKSPIADIPERDFDPILQSTVPSFLSAIENSIIASFKVESESKSDVDRKYERVFDSVNLVLSIFNSLMDDSTVHEKIKEVLVHIMDVFEKDLLPVIARNIASLYDPFDEQSSYEVRIEETKQTLQDIISYRVDIKDKKNRLR